jgi:hypothetical protein
MVNTVSRDHGLLWFKNETSVKPFKDSEFMLQLLITGWWLSCDEGGSYNGCGCPETLSAGWHLGTSWQDCSEKPANRVMYVLLQRDESMSGPCPWNPNEDVIFGTIRKSYNKFRDLCMSYRLSGVEIKDAVMGWT